MGKKPHLGKKRAKREDPSPSKRSGTQSASQRGPGTYHVQEPPPSQEAYQKKKGMVLFICLIAKVEQSHTL